MVLHSRWMRLCCMSVEGSVLEEAPSILSTDPLGPSLSSKGGGGVSQLQLQCHPLELTGGLEQGRGCSVKLLSGSPKDTKCNGEAGDFAASNDAGMRRQGRSSRVLGRQNSSVLALFGPPQDSTRGAGGLPCITAQRLSRGCEITSPVALLTVAAGRDMMPHGCSHATAAAWGSGNGAAGTRGRGDVTARDLALNCDYWDGVLCCRHHLQPLYINGGAKTFLHVDTLEDYQGLLARQMGRDAKLEALLKDTIRKLVHEECSDVVTHCLSGEPGAGSHERLITLEISPCAFQQQEGGPLVPCLMLHYSLGFTHRELQQRLQRDYILLSHIPSIVTVFDLNQAAVHQNRASIQYLGNLEAHGGRDDDEEQEDEEVEEGASMKGGAGGLSSLLAPATHLQQLMRLQPDKLLQLLEALQLGQEWEGVVLVPAAGLVFVPPCGEPAGHLDAYPLLRLDTAQNAVSLSADAAICPICEGDDDDLIMLGPQTLTSQDAERGAAELAAVAAHRRPPSDPMLRLSDGERPTSHHLSHQPLVALASSPPQFPRSRSVQFVDPDGNVGFGAAVGGAGTGPRCSASSGGRNSGNALGLGVYDLCKGRMASPRNGHVTGVRTSPNSPQQTARSPNSPQQTRSALQRALMLDGGRQTSTPVPGTCLPLLPPNCNTSDPLPPATLRPAGGAGPARYGSAAAAASAALSVLERPQQPLVPRLKLPVPPSVATGGAAYQQQQQRLHPACQPVWHEVRAKVFHDPVEGRDLILVVQTDVTSQVEAEARTADLLQAEQRVLENIFPRHVIEALTEVNRESSQTNLVGLSARTSTAGQAAPSFAATMEAASGQLVSGVSLGSGSAGAHSGGSFVGKRHGLSLLRSMQDAEHLSTYHEQVTIMFADIVGFTSMCQQVAPPVVMAFLNELYSSLDELVGIYRVYKVETAGDCYIVAGGLMRKDEDGYTSVRTHVDPLHALTVLEFAKALLRESAKVLNPVTGEPIKMRIGMHSGPVVSGVVGTKMPRFCLFGDTMNTSQRMESTSRPSAIHVSEATQKLLPKERWQPTGGVLVKGKGFMNTAFWTPSASRDTHLERHDTVSPLLHHASLPFKFDSTHLADPTAFSAPLYLVEGSSSSLDGAAPPLGYITRVGSSDAAAAGGALCSLTSAA